MHGTQSYVVPLDYVFKNGNTFEVSFIFTTYYKVTSLSGNKMTRGTFDGLPGPSIMEYQKVL